MRHTAQLSDQDLADSRALCDASYDEFGDVDWEHALGGMHVLVRSDDGTPRSPATGRPGDVW